MSIDDLRKEIDELDSRIVRLIAERIVLLPDPVGPQIENKLVEASGSS